MKLEWSLFNFHFNDPKWFKKFVIGGLLTLGAIVFFPLAWPLTGYMIRVMRATIKGEDPHLPEWDNWGELFKDGLNLFIMSLIYSLPLFPLYCGMMFFFTVPGLSFSSPVALTEMFPAIDPEILIGSGVGVGILSFMAGMVLAALLTPLAMLVAFFMYVAMTRLAAEGTLKAALDFRSVWDLGKRGFKHYAMAFLVYFGVSMVAGFVMSILFYTVIFLCLFPLVIGVYAMWIYPIAGVLMGQAYRFTTGMSPEEAAA